MCYETQSQAICNAQFSIIFQYYVKFIIKTHVSLMWENGTALMLSVTFVNFSTVETLLRIKAINVSAHH